MLRAIDQNMVIGGSGLGKIFLDFKERSARSNCEVCVCVKKKRKKKKQEVKTAGKGSSACATHKKEVDKSMLSSS